MRVSALVYVGVAWRWQKSWKMVLELQERVEHKETIQYAKQWCRGEEFRIISIYSLVL